MNWLVNRYWLVARVYPALLAFAPVLWSALILFPKLVSDVRKGAASAVAVGCILYLLSSLARFRGKIAERKLLKVWGGWPTTLFLRHRDNTIDPRTKARYHAALAALASDVCLPTADQETADPTEADYAYHSATKRLIELRRGKTYQMVEDENASYGFRRNLFGLKTLVLCVAFVSLILTGLLWWATITQPITITTIESSIKAYPHLPILFALDLTYAALIEFLVTCRFVRQASDEYALALLRTLDQPAAKSQSKRALD
jgi:hypothetical protein